MTTPCTDSHSQVHTKPAAVQVRCCCSAQAATHMEYVRVADHQLVSLGCQYLPYCMFYYLVYSGRIQGTCGRHVCVYVAVVVGMACWWVKAGLSWAMNSTSVVFCKRPGCHRRRVVFKQHQVNYLTERCVSSGNGKDKLYTLVYSSC